MDSNQEEHAKELDDNKEIATELKSNSGTSSSGGIPPASIKKINEGKSLTLEELVARIDAESGQLVDNVIL